jgi:phosphohistidine phosphatase
MEIYLVQHAEAKSEEEDAQRPLSDKGKEESERVAEALGKVGIRAKHIMHSGKLRAKRPRRYTRRTSGRQKQGRCSALRRMTIR